MLDLNSLEKSILALKKAVVDSEKFSESDYHDTLRSGAIQNFEVSYELCWKMMKRWIEVNIGISYVDGVTRRELFRLAKEHHLISDIDNWMEYHESRNATAHTYSPDTAGDVYNVAKNFLHDAEKLLQTMTKKND